MTGVVGYKLIKRFQSCGEVFESEKVSLHKDYLEWKKAQYDEAAKYYDRPDQYPGAEIYLHVIDKLSEEWIVTIPGKRRAVYGIHYGEVYAKTECELRRIYGTIRRRRDGSRNEFDEYPVVYSMTHKRWYPIKHIPMTAAERRRAKMREGI